jgi:hypothetical protein
MRNSSFDICDPPELFLIYSEKVYISLLIADCKTIELR